MKPIFLASVLLFFLAGCSATTFYNTEVDGRKIQVLGISPGFSGPTTDQPGNPYFYPGKHWFVLLQMVESDQFKIKQISDKRIGRDSPLQEVLFVTDLGSIVQVPYSRATHLTTKMGKVLPTSFLCSSKLKYQATHIYWEIPFTPYTPCLSMLTVKEGGVRVLNFELIAKIVKETKLIDRLVEWDKLAK